MIDACNKALWPHCYKQQCPLYVSTFYAQFNPAAQPESSTSYFNPGTNSSIFHYIYKQPSQSAFSLRKQHHTLGFLLSLTGLIKQFIYETLVAIPLINYTGSFSEQQIQNKDNTHNMYQLKFTSRLYYIRSSL